MIRQSPILTKLWRRSPPKDPWPLPSSLAGPRWPWSILVRGRGLCAWSVLGATLLAAVGAKAQEPPKGLLRELAASGSLFEKERGHYTYRQVFFFQELGARGMPEGSYREVREIIFSPEGRREEQMVGWPADHLKQIRLTEEDFRDIRDMQPFVLTGDTLRQYEFKFKGSETLDGEDCFVFRMQPRQILEGQRLLDGLIWVSSKHRQLVKAAGQPVPQIYRDKEENLFPEFATIYRPIDGKFWFPVRTVASDTLPFRSGPRQVKYVIEYENYKRFSAESSINFDKTDP